MKTWQDRLGSWKLRILSRWFQDLALNPERNGFSETSRIHSRFNPRTWQELVNQILARSSKGFQHDPIRIGLVKISPEHPIRTLNESYTDLLRKILKRLLSDPFRIQLIFNWSELRRISRLSCVKPNSVLNDSWNLLSRLCIDPVDEQSLRKLENNRQYGCWSGSWQDWMRIRLNSH